MTVRRHAVTALAELSSRSEGPLGERAISLLLDVSADEDARLRLHALRTLEPLAGRVKLSAAQARSAAVAAQLVVLVR